MPHALGFPEAKIQHQGNGSGGYDVLQGYALHLTLPNGGIVESHGRRQRQLRRGLRLGVVVSPGLFQAMREVFHGLGLLLAAEYKKAGRGRT